MDSKNLGVLALIGAIAAGGYYLFSQKKQSNDMSGSSGGAGQIDNYDPNTTTTAGSANKNLDGLLITTSGSPAPPNSTNYTYNIDYNLQGAGALTVPNGLFGTPQQQTASSPTNAQNLNGVAPTNGGFSGGGAVTTPANVVNAGSTPSGRIVLPSGQAVNPNFSTAYSPTGTAYSSGGKIYVPNYSAAPTASYVPFKNPFA